jgi:hypothetical protein
VAERPPGIAHFHVANVRGLGEALATLKQMAPELEKEARAELRRIVKPMMQTARDMVPTEPPLSRWNTGSAEGAVHRSGASRMPAWTGAAKRRVGFRIRKQKPKTGGGRIILLRMIQTDAAGAVFDVAGRRNDNQFSRNITSKGYGEASRHMWPAAEKHLGDVQDAIREAQQEMEKTINARLRRGGRI